MNTPDFSAAADCSKQPILAVLRQLLGPTGQALEIASGSGQHVNWFAATVAGWTWQPTDAQPAALAFISARAAEQALTHVQPPLPLDVLTQPWLSPHRHFDLIYFANMLHTSPWATCTALMQGAELHLAPEGRLVT